MTGNPFTNCTCRRRALVLPFIQNRNTEDIAMPTVTVKLPAPLAAKLAKVARAKRMNKSSILREALERYIDAAGGRERVSCLDLVGDLAGCLEGPSDLSHNKKHMKGFGQ